MKGVELEIVPVSPTKCYFSGDTARGKVSVIVHEEWQCDGLELSLGAKGILEIREMKHRFILTQQEDLMKKTLYQGRWSADVYTYPFEIQVPTGFYSYQGKTIKLTWVLKAEARSSKGESVEAETELAVVPGKEVQDEDLHEKRGEIVHKESPKGSMGCLVVFFLLFLGGAGAAVKTFQSGNDTLLGFAFFFAAVGLVIVLINIYFIMISKRIGMVEVRIGSGLASPGETVPCGLIFMVKKPVELKGVYVTLTCWERGGNVGIRASKKTYTEVVYEKRQELQLPVKQVPANSPIETRGEFLVPVDAPLSFVLADTLGRGIEVRWDVEFRIAMNRWPDWAYKEKITVRPGKPS